jgi:hypothetical protein
MLMPRPPWPSPERVSRGLNQPFKFWSLDVKPMRLLTQDGKDITPKPWPSFNALPPDRPYWIWKAASDAVGSP